MNPRQSDVALTERQQAVVNTLRLALTVAERGYTDRALEMAVIAYKDWFNADLPRAADA